MDYTNQIKALRAKNDNAKIQKAKSETRLEELQKKRDGLLTRCQDLGVTPESLPLKIQEGEAKMQELMQKANELLPKEQDSPF